MTPKVDAARGQAEARLRAVQEAAAGRGTGRGRLWLGALLVLVLLSVAWAHTFVEMWDRWFPHWKFASASLGDRLSKGDSYYTHSPLVILTSLVIAFFVYRRVGTPSQSSRGATLAGWALVGGSALLHLLSVLYGVTFVSGFAFIGMLAGVVLWWGGWPLARAYWLPIAILVFMVPLPEVAIYRLSFDLKMLAGGAANWATNHLFGVDAVMVGSNVYLPSDAAGHVKVLTVEDVCSGLRSLISLTFFASLFALVCRVKGYWRLVMLLMAVPVAVLSNVVRITSLNLVAHYYSVADASEAGWFHGFSGMMVFAVALALLFGLEQGIIGLSKVLKRRWTDARLLGYLDAIPRDAGQAPRVWRPVPLVVLALVAGLSVLLARQPPPVNRDALARSIVPVQFTLADGTTVAAVGADQSLTSKEMEILENPSYLCRQFAVPGGGQNLDLLVVFSANNRKAVHPPEVCLTGSGWTIVEEHYRTVALPGRAPIQIKELRAEAGGQERLFLYVYRCGDSYTPSFLWQQGLVAWSNAVWWFTGRDAAAALIRLSLPITNHNIQEAEGFGLRAAGQLIPDLDRGLRADGGKGRP
jgi:EpsI family protein